MSMTMEEENIKVAVRIRPMQLAERKDGDIPCVKASADGKEVQVKVGPLDASSYRCNQCFSNETTQAQFFNECGITELLDSSMKGYRACAFAFGQTGAGKTFTMIGNPKGNSTREKQQTGLIARSLEYLFQKLDEAGVQFSIKVSCLEIYHEQVFDLFADEKDRTPLAVREHSADGFFIEGCKLIDCINYPVAQAALETAVRNRQTGSHDLNSRSSRSHCLTEIHIEIPVTVGEDGNIGGGVGYDENGESKPQEGKLAQGEYVSKGKISLVDLAGSERLKSTKSTGKVLLEAGFINKSLYVLGKVIAGLIRTNGDLNHKDVPYRDSKLTKLLISSLGGRSRTLLISCVSEAKSNQAETLRTLKFSMSCARIRNKPMKFLDPQEKLILDLKEEIRRLRNENKKLRSNLLTAPASGEKHHSSGGFGGGRNSDDESSVMSRAYSAHSSLDKERIQFKPRNGGKIYGSKMNASQSDYLKKLSPIKHRSGSKPKREMTKEEALRMLDDIRAATHKRTAATNAASNTAPLLREIDEESLGSGVSSSKRQAAAEMEDLIRRRATGPMIFRGTSGIDISPVRDSRPSGAYAPAQNGMRSMDALRIEELEKRIARMETGVLSHQQSFPHDHHAQARAQLQTIAQMNGEHLVSGALPGQYDGILPGYDSTVLASVVGKKKKKKKVEEVPLVWKGKNSAASPYIAHLIEKAPKTAQDKSQFGVKIAAENREGHTVTVANARPVIAAPRPSQLVDESDTAFGVKAAGAGICMPRPAGRNSAEQLRSAIAVAGSSNRPPAGKEPVKGAAKDLHSSILDELAELGLGPPSAAAAAAPTQTGTHKRAPQKLTTKARDREESGSRSRARPGPVHSKPTTKPASSLPSLPPPTVDSAGNLSKASRGTAHASANVKKHPSSLPPTKGKPAVLPPMQQQQQQRQREKPRASSASDVPTTPLKKANTASDPSALKAKLETLERSLAEEREKMEDNPGEVTAEAEEHYEELTKQAKMLRRKLEMSGVDLDIIIPSSDVNAEADAGMGNSRDEDMMPTPEAVKLMARQMESINAPMAKKNAPAVSVSSTRSGSREGLLSPAVSRKHSSNSTSKKEAPQTANSSPAARIAVSNNGDGNEEYEDDAYADEDFEEDVRSKPGTAHRPEHPAPKIMLVTEISRRFDQGDLLVPDLEELTKNSTTEAEKLAHAPSNISINSQPDEEFDVTTKSNSMRHSGAAAVHQALSFVADEQPDFLGKISAGPSFTNDVDPPPPTSAVQKVADPEATQENEDPYAEDTYDDDFIDADADAEPTSVRVKSAAMAISEVSPSPISTTSLQSSPATLQPLTSSKYDREDDDEVRISSSASPMPSRAPVLVPSGEASPVKSTAVVAASTTAKTQDKEKEEDAYEEDNYEDEFDADEGEASSPAKAASMKASPVPSPKVASSYQPLQKQEIEVSNDNDADFDELSYQLSSKKVAADQEEAVSAAVLPAAAAAAESYKTPITTSSYTAPADEDDYELDPTPVASMKVKTDSPVRESVASVSEPTPSAPAPSSVAIDIVSATVVSPPMQSEPRAQSAPGDDEYAADEFDDYDVSFGEQDP